MSHNLEQKKTHITNVTESDMTFAEATSDGWDTVLFVIPAFVIAHFSHRSNALLH